MFLYLLAIVLLSGCDQADEKFKSYSIGFTTQGQEVSVDAVHIDSQWSVPGGVSISGVWGEASGGSSVFNKAMPHEIRINWRDKKTDKRYEATVKLVADIAKRAKKLPPTRLIVAQTSFRDIYIINGLAMDGKITTWLSNSPYASGITGRVLEVIGEAQGTLTNEIPPYYPPLK